LDAFPSGARAPEQLGSGAPQPTGQPFLFTGGSWDIDNYLDPFDDFKQRGASLSYQHDFDFAHLTNITAYRDADKNLFWSAQPIPTAAEQAGWLEKERQITEELQVSSPDHSVISGGRLLLPAWACGLSAFYDRGHGRGAAPLGLHQLPGR